MHRSTAAILGLVLIVLATCWLTVGCRVDSGPVAADPSKTVSSALVVSEPSQTQPSESDSRSTTQRPASGALLTPGEATTTSSPSAPTTTVPPEPRVVIAWQPSHQDDTGYDDWHEYIICGDIVERVMALAQEFGHVMAWETGMGLTGSNNRGGTNRDAFDSELKQANEAKADVFISVHVNGGGASGVFGMHFTDDAASRQVAAALAKAIADGLDWPQRPTREADLYSLDPVRNDAEIRVLLEIGDNVADREFLEDPDNRQRIAEILSKALPAALAGLDL